MALQYGHLAWPFTRQLQTGSLRAAASKSRSCNTYPPHVGTLGVPQRTPNITVLAKTCQLPLYIHLMAGTCGAVAELRSINT